MSRSRRWTVRLAAVAVGICGAFGLMLAVEVGVRISQPHVDPMVAFCASPGFRMDLEFPNQLKATRFDRERDWRLAENLKDLPWCGTPVTTNADGIRMDGPLRPKRANTLRIVCLGDSVTFGYGVPFYWEGKWNAEDKAYPAVMEASLRASVAGRNVEVISLACPGYTSEQGRLWYADLAARLEADIVTACFGRNDVMSFGVPDRKVRTGEFAQRFLRTVAPYSQAVTHLVARSRAKSAGPSNPPGLEYSRLSLEESIENFWQLAQAVKAGGAEFVVIAPVYRDLEEEPAEGRRMAALRGALRTLCEQGGLLWLEVQELTENAHPQNKDLFMERIHPNVEGHKLMGRRLAEGLRDLVERR
jgi:lysophospholipase L1-like esterase